MFVTHTTRPTVDPHLLAAKVTGAPAVLIILVILALIIIGLVAVVRFVIRKGRGN